MISTKIWQVISKVTKNDVSVSDISEILLMNRGLNSKVDQEEFFDPKDPFKISLSELEIDGKEIKLAIKRIKVAIEKKEEVLVYGDYDADGVSATAIFWETLFNLGAKALPYIPERFTEGYGLNIESIKKLKKEKPNLSLIITVDHGIVADKKVDLAHELGIDVIITDHHQPGAMKPKPKALVHTTKIGGAGVAWILARELVKEVGTEKNKKEIEELLELVALGTIADQIPLLGPNRSFVNLGLAKLSKTKRPGLLELYEISGIKSDSIGPYEVGFLIAPRINAMGRLEHAMESLRLICTRKSDKARELALQMNKVNLERQKVVDEVLFHAKNSLGNDFSGNYIVLADESYHEGVIGLVASRLVEEFYVPTIILSKKGEISKASARSVSGFNIIESIRTASEFLIDGGGHPMAAGFSLKTKDIENFVKKFEEKVVKDLTQEILTKKLKIDLELNFELITPELLALVKKFEPSGLGNPTPVFVTKNVYLKETKVIGKDGTHLKIKLGKDKIFDAIGFGMAEKSKFKNGSTVDIVYALDENVWNGRKSIQLKLKDMRLSEN